MTQTLSLSKVVKLESGWYRGDFHAHTTFSDGYYDPPDLMEVARTEGLDFFTVTDHNTIDAFSHFGSPGDILIIPGLEVTMDEGHYNVFGIEGYSDWMEHICTDQNKIELQGKYETVPKVMRQAAAEGLLNSINHPLLIPWAWLDNNADLRHLHCLEICNDPTFIDNAANPQAVDMWTRWLNAGYRITAIGGTDYHYPQFKPGYSAPQRLSFPTTYVYAKELSGAAILAGLRQHRAYVSMGPQATFQAQVNGTTYDIGADLGKLEGNIEFRATVSHALDPVYVRLVKNGSVFEETTVENGQGNLQSSDQAVPSQPAWYRLDVIGQNGEILVVTNPIFVGPRRQPTLYKYGDFVNL